MNRQPTHLLAGPATVEVHVARLNDCMNEAKVRLLPDADRRRADAFRSRELRGEFLGSRIFLRGVLARKLGCSLAGVKILEGPNDKPVLEGGNMEFSLSYRRGWCAVAVSSNCPVGVDVEPVRLFPAMADVVSQFFPQKAKAEFARAPPRSQPTVFFRWWARIEAAVKAAGSGLDGSVSSLDGVWYESYDCIDSLALATAAMTRHPVAVYWRVNT